MHGKQTEAMGPCSHQCPISEDRLSGTVFKLNSFKLELLKTYWNPVVWYLSGNPGQVAGSKYFAASTSLSNWTSTEFDWFITEWSLYSKRDYDSEFYSFNIIKKTRPCFSVFVLFCFDVIKRMVHIGVEGESWSYYHWLGWSESVCLRQGDWRR